MDQAQIPQVRQWSSRSCLAAGIVILGWTLVIYPIAFEYSSRELRANVAGDSRLGFASESFPRMVSGWFTVCLGIGSSLAFCSFLLVRATRCWRVAQIGITVISVSLIALHIIFNGPVYVAQNGWGAVTHPSSFRWPVHYFSTALENWGAWP